MRRFFWLAIFVFISNSSFSQVWNLKAPYPGNCGRNGCSFSIGSKAYAVSGACNEVWAYDTLLNNWTHLSNFPGSAGGTQVGFSVNGKGYVGTGTGFGYYFDSTMWEYTPGTDTWEKLPHFPGAPRGYATGFVIDDTVYIGGGFSSNGSVSRSYQDFYAYNVNNRTWKRIADCPAEGCNQNAASFTIGGEGYVGIGDVIDSGASASTVIVLRQDFWKYNPATDTWTRIADFPAGPRTGAVGFAICNSGYVGLGTTNSSQTTFTNDFWRYDATKNQWKQIPNFPGSPRAYASRYIIGKSAFVGIGDASPTYPDFYEFNNVYTPAFSADSSVCTGQSISFTDTSNYSPTNWQWNFPGGIPGESTIQNPTIEYDTSGTYDVTLTAWNDCDSASKTFTNYITVGAGSKLSILANPPAICTGQSSTLTASGGVNYSWSPLSGLNMSTGSSVTANPTITTSYIVVSSGGSCVSAPDTVVLTVSSSALLTVSPSDTVICSGMSVQLNVSGGSGYTWSPAASLDDSTISNPVATPTTPTTYTVSAGACATPVQVVINVGNAAVGGAIIALRDTICEGTPGSLTLTGNTSNTIQWQSSLNDTAFTNLVNDTLAGYKTIPLMKTTLYRVLVGTGSCSAISDTLQLYVPPPLTAYFNATQPSGSTLAFNSDSSSGSIRSYHWDFGDNSTSTDKNPSHTYTKDTTYYVCLTLYDGSNCSYTFCRYSEVTDAVPFISASGNWVIYPNPFSSQLTITGKQINSRVQSIELYDVLGRLVINRNTGTENNTLNMDVSSLTNGMYYLMIRTTGGNYGQKVIKQ